MFIFSSASARIWIAKIAALIAPGLPMAIEATGMPGGIWTVLSKASMPAGPSAAARGTPIMGNAVLAARAPAR